MQFSGWEDAWMKEWKRKHYSPGQPIGCKFEKSTPHVEGVECTFPAFVPARVRPASPQLIPRVIFMSWIDRRLGETGFHGARTWMDINPEYEIVLMTDADVDHMVCENFPLNISEAFSALVHGAARTDLWRLLLMQRYGGVYVDFDMGALAPLPIGANDSVVSGCGRYSGGVLEHWAMAYTSGHPFIDATIGRVLRNIGNRMPSIDVILITGPGPYGDAVHDVVLSRCPEAFKFDGIDGIDSDDLDPSKMCSVMMNLKHICSPQAMGEFGEMRIFDTMLFNHTMSCKRFQGKAETMPGKGFGQYDCNSATACYREDSSSFCSAEGIAARKTEHDSRWRTWAKAVFKKTDRSWDIQDRLDQIKHTNAVRERNANVFKAYKKGVPKEGDAIVEATTEESEGETEEETVGHTERAATSSFSFILAGDLNWSEMDAFAKARNKRLPTTLEVQTYLNGAPLKGLHGVDTWVPTVHHNAPDWVQVGDERFGVSHTDEYGYPEWGAHNEGNPERGKALLVGNVSSVTKMDGET